MVARRCGSGWVLTACRIGRFAAEGTHCSKTAAARWALGRDPSFAAVRRALAQRTGGAVRTFDPRDVRAVIETALKDVQPD